ncbi:hypothetical protein LZ30DRAFT_743519 [Colletotrichum cereale]|nr:hypothetical protein LZ30DRAFT_743519 [Colletotrichum cereale]
MRFATLSILVLATSVAAKQFCLGRCMKCYCGDVMYESHDCWSCSCDHNKFISGNASTPRGTCDLPGGFHQGCGWINEFYYSGTCT